MSHSSSGKREFWTLQVGGWATYIAAITIPWLGDYALRPMLEAKALLAATGMVTTLALRALYRGLLERQATLRLQITAAIGGSFVGALLWSAAINWLAQVVVAGVAATDVAPSSHLFDGASYHTLVLFAWSLLYLGIRHHRAFQAERARSLRAEAREGDLVRRLSTILAERTANGAGDSGRAALDGRLLVKDRGRIVLLDVAEIDWIQAEGDYVRLHVGSKSYLVRETMAAMEARLGGSRFVRIHRSAIVRVDRVRELRPQPNKDCVVVLRDGVQVRSSRSYGDRLRGAFGEAL